MHVSFDSSITVVDNSSSVPPKPGTNNEVGGPFFPAICTSCMNQHQMDFQDASSPGSNGPSARHQKVLRPGDPCRKIEELLVEGAAGGGGWNGEALAVAVKLCGPSSQLQPGHAFLNDWPACAGRSLSAMLCKEAN